MSYPFYRITCSGCGFEDGYDHATEYVYEGPPDHRPVLKNAWCGDCYMIVAVCSPFKLEDAQWEIDCQNNLIERNQSGIFAKFSRSKKHRVQKAHQEIQAIKERLKYFESIQYMPRCIYCGGHNVSSFDLPYRRYHEAKLMKIKHICGGQLLISMEGRFNIASGPQVVYDEQGTILRGDRKQKTAGVQTSGKRELKAREGKSIVSLSEGKVTILVPCYLYDPFPRIFEAMGYSIIWADNLKDLINLAAKNDFDIALEWQHGPEDFPIRDMLHAIGKEKPIILCLNWNGKVPDNYPELGYADTIPIRWEVEELKEKIRNILNGK